MSTPVNPTTNVAYRVLEALGYGSDPDRARLIVAMWARPVRRLSVAEVREVLAAVDAAVPHQRSGQQYDRPVEPGTQGTGRPWSGARDNLDPGETP